MHDVTVGAACPGGTCDSSGACVPPSCTDGVMNGTETDVDCGGGCAPPSTCATGQACERASDCASGVCGGDSRCAAPTCGDGVVQAGEMCDDGNMTDGDGCDDGSAGSCRPTGCGNGVVTGNEACDDGNAVNGDGCDANCTVSACGNGVTAGAETCDDGNTVPADGCSATCVTEAGWHCTATVPSTCSADCGDGVVTGSEACDDGNLTSGDGCDRNCTVTACGNGVVTGAEACDDGNLVSSDGCSASCAVDLVALAEREPNEDGTISTSPGSGFSGNDFDGAGGIAVANATAQGVIRASQGDAFVVASLAPAGDEDVFAVTNDTPYTASLQPDLWNLADGFGVGVVCRLSALISFRVRDAAGASLLYGGNRTNFTDACGGGKRYVMAPGQTVYVHVMEQDDDGQVPSYGLTLDFTLAVCGDGVVFPGVEECDDGNTTNGDSCSSICMVQGVAEVEPNEDGTPTTGGAGYEGNDFDVGGTRAVTNARSQGVHDVATGRRIWIGALRVGPLPGTAGDEDVYAVTNSGAVTLDVSADLYMASTGLDRPCSSNTDIGITVRDALGTELARRASRSPTDSCGNVPFPLAPGATRYIHLVEWGDDAVKAKYFLVVDARPVACGDGVFASMLEECDDGNATDGDGCSAVCTVEATSEREPNEDGTPGPGGAWSDGNDFDVGGMLAIGNATAQGVYDAQSGRHVWRGELRVGALPGQAGDEDVYVVDNTRPVGMWVTATLSLATTGFGNRCSFLSLGPPSAPQEDVVFNVRDASGQVLTQGLMDSDSPRCGRAAFFMPASSRRYLHVVEWNDDFVTGGYFLSIDPHPAVCGDGVWAPIVEGCDDGSTVDGDGCSSTCDVEAGWFCGQSPSTCYRTPTLVPLACTDMTGAATLLATGNDDMSFATPFPFPVRLYGRSNVHFVASTNGFVEPLTGDMATPSYSGPVNPHAIPDRFGLAVGTLAPFWDDLILSGPGLLAKTTGAAPDRVFTIEWNAATRDTPTATGLRVQVQFREDGFVEYHYCAGGGDMARATGGRATISSQDPTRQVGYAYSIITANAVIPGVTALRWDLR